MTTTTYVDGAARKAVPVYKSDCCTVGEADQRGEPANRRQG